MGNVVLGTVISLDGFINDRDGSASRLYRDMGELVDNAMVQEAMEKTGAVVMGKRSYELGNGDYTGYEFQVPLFVVTHQAPEQVAKGENDKLSFTFVTDGVESAIRQAKAAAGDKDVTIVGGADIAQQALKSGLVDELQLDVVSVLLGEGLRYFEHMEGSQIELESTKVQNSGGITQLYFRVIR